MRNDITVLLRASETGRPITGLSEAAGGSPAPAVGHTARAAALTRRFENVSERTDREFGIVKSDLTALRLQVGNLDQKVGNLQAQLSDIAERMDRNQAQIVELLTQLVGRDPNAS
ncbi:hypothetical protein [Streptomyces sp. NPDC001435]|uniref:hypothetical protein n=1 Tax=unclassified Streptomyces TaxID=2593676 RepID=UPI0036807E19